MILDSVGPNEVGANLVGLAGDEEGHGFVVWAQADAQPGLMTSVTQYVRRFDGSAARWTPPVPLGPGDLTWFSHALAAKGNALVGWNGSLASYDGHKDAWSVTTLPLSFQVANIAFDDLGHAIAGGWANTDQVFSVSSDASRVWTSPALDAVPGPSVVFDLTYSQASDGRITTWWTTREGSSFVLRRKRSDDMGRPAGPVEVVTELPLTNDVPTLVGDRRGGVTATWAESTSQNGMNSATNTLFATRYSPDRDTWSPTQTIEQAPTSFAGLPTIVNDEDGNSFMAWYRTNDTGPKSLHASTLRAGTGLWSPPDVVASDVISSAAHSFYGLPALAARGGDAVALTVADTGGLWLHLFDGSQQAWTASYLVASVGPKEIWSGVLPVFATLDRHGHVLVAWAFAHHILASRCDVRLGTAR